MGHLADCLAAGRPLDADRLVQDALLTEEVAAAIAAGAAPHHLLPPSDSPTSPCAQETSHCLNSAMSERNLPADAAPSEVASIRRFSGKSPNLCCSIGWQQGTGRASILACRSWSTPVSSCSPPLSFFCLIRLCIIVRSDCCAGAGATAVTRSKQPNFLTGFPNWVPWRDSSSTFHPYHFRLILGTCHTECGFGKRLCSRVCI